MGRRDINNWYVRKGPPPAKAGDWIKPNGRYRYTGNHMWAYDEPRMVQFVGIENKNTPYEKYVYAVINPHTNQISQYNPTNFELAGVLPEQAPYTKQETTKVTITRAKYFAVKLDKTQDPESEINGLCIDTTGSFTTTPPRDSKHQVTVDVGKRIKEGERWLVVQVLSMIEGEEPRPPMKITEYAR